VVDDPEAGYGAGGLGVICLDARLHGSGAGAGVRREELPGRIGAEMALISGKSGPREIFDARTGVSLAQSFGRNGLGAVFRRGG